MVELFLEKNSTRYGELIPSNTGNVYNRIKTYMDNVISYFHNSNINASNNNIIVKIINEIGIDYNWNIYTILQYVSNSITGIRSTLKISDEYNMFAIEHGIMFNTTEMLYLNNRTNITNIRNIDLSNWRDYSPVRVKNHEFIDMYLNHPLLINGMGSIAIYDIDIIGLIIMYKYYCLDRKSAGLNIDTHQFVARYVLTNMIPSMCDIVLLNRYLGKGSIYCINRQRIGATAVNIIDTDLKQLKMKLNVLSNNKHFIIEMLRNIKLITNKDAYEMLVMKNYYETYRNRIYLTLVLFDYIQYIIKFIDMNKYSNPGYASRLKKYISIMINGNIYLNNDKLKMRVDNILTTLNGEL